MKEILIEIDRLAEEEMERANKIHPMFHSDHEGWAVLQEEIEEAAESTQLVRMGSNRLWEAIRDNDEDASCKMAYQIKAYAGHAAFELTQVIAMCDKFIKSQEERKCQRK